MGAHQENDPSAYAGDSIANATVRATPVIRKVTVRRAGNDRKPAGNCKKIVCGTPHLAPLTRQFVANVQ
jgi:hypothetical protein